jgi:hypothetical protein
MSFISDPNAVLALPQIFQSMQNDPRVALAKAQLAAGGDTSAAYGWGPGLARLLQGVTGGLGTRANEKRYGAAQSAYMDEMRQKIATLLGGGNMGAPGATSPGGVDSINVSPHGPMSIGDGAGIGGGEANNGVNTPDGQAVGINGVRPLPSTADPNVLPPQRGGPTLAPPGPFVPPTGAPGMGPSSMPTGASGMPPMGGPPSGQFPPMGDGMSPGGGGTGGPPLNPGMPAPPDVPSPLQSTRLRLGQALMGGKSPYSFMEGLQDVNAGLEEKAQNEALAQARQFELGKARYGAELGDYYGARGDARSAEYTRQGDERRNRYNEQELATRFRQQWMLQKDQQGFDRSQKNYDRMFDMYKLYADTYGKLPDDLSALDPANVGPDAVWKSMVTQESGGEKSPGTAVSSQGALGSTQLEPGTAQEMATKLGLPWKPELLHSNSEEALAYQQALGRAYFQEGMDKYDGDVRKAVMYYHGGPDEAQWGPKTQSYANQVLGRIAGASGTSYNSIFAPPKSAANTGNMFGIDVNSNPRKPVPSRAIGSLTDLGDQATQFLNLRQRFQDSYFGHGPLGRGENLFTEYTGVGDKDRVDWWKTYDMMNNVVRRSLFGSALTRNEEALWNRSVVSPGTNSEIARKRLDTQWGLLERAMSRNARGSSAAYNGRQVYEYLGGDDMADMIAHDKPLYGGEARKDQVRAGGAIPKGITITLDGPQPSARAVPMPKVGTNAITDPTHFDWLRTQVPGSPDFNRKLQEHGYTRF